MEQEPTYKKERIRWAKAHVQGAQVEANRQFFDEFDAMFENNAIEAFKFLADHRKWVTDLDAIYLEIRQREQAPKAKGLPPRVVILPDWDGDDEKRCQEDQAEEKKHAASGRRKTTKKRAPKLANPPHDGIARRLRCRKKQRGSADFSDTAARPLRASRFSSRRLRFEGTKLKCVKKVQSQGTPRARRSPRGYHFSQYLCTRQEKTGRPPETP
jgi:hypothetical protein